jgi:hypothetical protein
MKMCSVQKTRRERNKDRDLLLRKENFVLVKNKCALKNEIMRMTTILE